MKINASLSNAQMLRESWKVLHQQHLQDLQRLNRQKEEFLKTQQDHRQWVSAAHVDVMV